MKYEMIFGDAGLFDGAPDDAEYAGWFCQETRWYMILNGKILFSDGGSWCTSDNPYLSADIAAMRRIIKEPKRWTVEDKKAGRLPEVGAEYFDKNKCVCVFLFSDAEGYLWGRTEKSMASCTSLQLALPIETPEEKAKREEDEFVDVIVSEYNNMPSSISFKAGIRAAYRKLKGGE